MLSRMMLAFLLFGAGPGCEAPEDERPRPQPLEAEGGPAIDEAKAAALAWLELVDNGDYGRSWDQAAAYFRQSVPRPQWETQVGGVRRPLGAVNSREVTSATLATTLPGAPDGEYVVIQYATSFANKASAVETVTPMRDPDGRFRVSGYFVQ